MPRASDVFTKQGWSIIPYPVDYQTRKESDWIDFSVRRGIGTWELVLHELAGTVAYKLSGRI